MVRESIKNNRFPEFIKNFMTINYPDKNFPVWIIDALQSVNINLLEKESTTASNC